MDESGVGLFLVSSIIKIRINMIKQNEITPSKFHQIHFMPLNSYKKSSSHFNKKRVAVANMDKKKVVNLFLKNR